MHAENDSRGVYGQHPCSHGLTTLNFLKENIPAELRGVCPCVAGQQLLVHTPE